MINSFGKTTTASALTVSGNRLTLNPATAPFQLPHPGGGFVVLMTQVTANGACQVTAAEIMQYSGYEADGVTLILTGRGKESTTAQAWPAGTVVTQPLLMSELQSLSGSTPAGGIIWFPASTPPAGFVKCNGASISRTAYAALYAVIGTIYGSGNGSTTFNLPDLRGEFIRGWDDGRAADPSRQFGSWQDGTYFFNGSGFTTVHVPQDGGFVEGEDGSKVFPNVPTQVSSASQEIEDRFYSRARPRNIALLPCIKY